MIRKRPSPHQPNQPPLSGPSPLSRISTTNNNSSASIMPRNRRRHGHRRHEKEDDDGQDVQPHVALIIQDDNDNNEHIDEHHQYHHHHHHTSNPYATMDPVWPYHVRAPSSAPASSTSPLKLPLVQDRHYPDFLLGRRRRNSKSWWDAQQCARGCAGFSLVAILFLLFVAILIDRQPLLIKGVRIQTSKYPNSAAVLAPVISTHAYQAAMAYFFTLLLSISYGWNVGCRTFLQSQWRQRRRSQYSDIPDACSTLTTFHVEGGFDKDDMILTTTDHLAGGGVLPMYARNSSSSSSSTRVAALWNRWIVMGWRKQRSDKKPKRG